MDKQEVVIIPSELRKGSGFDSSKPTLIQKYSLYIFLFLALVVVVYGYLYPLLKYPNENSTPWPEAYQVIQKEIIEQQKVPPDYVYQFGMKQKSDMVYFLNHHLMAVSFKLTSGVGFELQERFLTVLLTLTILLSAYVCFRKMFGRDIGFWVAVLFMFLPRNFNYYTNFNGEFVSFIILFLALYFIFDWLREKNSKSLILGGLIAGVLPILCMINLGILLIVITSYGLCELLTERSKLKVIKNYLLSFMVILIFTVVISGIPLMVSKNLFAGKSSSIGSVYSQRSDEEIVYEKKYYKEFATYGRNFYKYPPIVRDLYYASLDGSQINYIIIYYLALAIFGLMLFIKKEFRSKVLPAFIFAVLLIVLEVFLYSRFFNDNIYNSALRFLLYFMLPLIFLGGIGINYISKKHHIFQILFLVSITLSGLAAIKQSAHPSNMYESLYGQPYKNAMLWLKQNMPENDLLLSNDWTNGQFDVQAERHDVVESGKASAAYSTYTDIYKLLYDAREILNPAVSPELTKGLMEGRKIKYIVIWNRPAAYQIFPYYESLTKMDSLSYVEKVYSDESTNQHGFVSQVTIYKVNTWQF